MEGRKSGRKEDKRKMGKVERGILNVLGGYEKKARISQKEAPAVRKVYRTCKRQYTKHQRCERYIERVYLIQEHDTPFCPLGLTKTLSHSEKSFN